MRGVEAGDVVARQCLHALCGADGRSAIRMIAIDQQRAYSLCDGGDGVTFLADGDEPLLADAVEVLILERGMLNNVGEQVHALCGVVGEHGHAGGGAIHAGADADACTDTLLLFGERGEITRGGGLAHGLRGDDGEPTLAGGVGLAAGACDDGRGEDGQRFLRDEVHLQSVVEREGLGRWQLEV